MGVKGLQEFLETEPSLKAGVSTVDLVRSSWAREGKVTSQVLHLTILKVKPCAVRLVGGPVVMRLSSMPRLHLIVSMEASTATGAVEVSGTTIISFGHLVIGQWNHMLEFLSVLFQSLQQANVHVAAFIDGTSNPSRKQEWIAQQLKKKQNVKQVLRHVGKRGTPPPKIWWVAPTGLRSVLRLGLRYLGVPIMASLDQHCLEVIHFLRENGYHGLLGDSSEYCIFDPPKYYSASKLKLTLKFTVETQMINMDEVRNIDPL